MRTSEPVAHARADQQLEQLREAVEAGRSTVYGLSRPVISPCALGAAHLVDGAWRAVTLIYGSWDRTEPHIRVSTQEPGFTRDQSDPTLPGDSAADTPVPFHFEDRDDPAPGTLRREGAFWYATAAVGNSEVVVSGFGDSPEDLHLSRVLDLGPAIDARRQRHYRT